MAYRLSGVDAPLGIGVSVLPDLVFMDIVSIFSGLTLTCRVVKRQLDFGTEFVQ